MSSMNAMQALEHLIRYYREKEGLIGPVDDAYSVEHHSARAKLLELISEARRAELLLRDMAQAGFGDPHQADGLRVTLARVGGAS